MDKENEIIELLNKLVKAINQLSSDIKEFAEKYEKEEDWYDQYDAMEKLDVGRTTLYRIRISHPYACKKLTGKWFYNVKLLMFFQDK